MTYYRQILDNASETVIIPAEFRHRRIELILLPLDEVATNGNDFQHPMVTVDANGWPAGFFEETEGRWAGEPLVREAQGDYETRLEFE